MILGKSIFVFILFRTNFIGDIFYAFTSNRRQWIEILGFDWSM